VVIKEKSVSEGLGGYGDRTAKDAEEKTGERSNSDTPAGGRLDEDGYRGDQPHHLVRPGRMQAAEDGVRVGG
jgi:hypothetical protein